MNPPLAVCLCLRRGEDEKESVGLWENVLPKHVVGLEKKEKKKRVGVTDDGTTVGEARVCVHFQFRPSPSSFLLLPLLPLLIMMRG